MNTKDCPSCKGRGKVWLSCCGDDMYLGNRSDVQICPTCKEHTGDESDDAEDCEDCGGTGQVEVVTRPARIPQYWGEGYPDVDALGNCYSDADPGL